MAVKMAIILIPVRQSGIKVKVSVNNHNRLIIQGSSKEPEILNPSFAKFYYFEVTLSLRILKRTIFHILR